MDKDDEYIYQLLEFVRPGPKTKKSVDFVPSHWISYDPKKARLLCKFLPPPYSEETCKLLSDLVRLRCDAPKDWPEYTVHIRGGASKHI